MSALTVFSVILAVVAAACYVFGILSVCQKGFLFNNVYIYSSESQRKSMNKKPYYIQSGIVLLLVGTVFLINAAQVFFRKDWLFYPSLAVIIITLIYAIVSTYKIQNKKD